MASSSDPLALGTAIAAIRRSKGLTQKQVADRISTRYSDDRAYRRVERGERLPDRDSVIDILAKGLEVADNQTINEVLALARYAPLTAAESKLPDPGVTQPPASPSPAPEPSTDPPGTILPDSVGGGVIALLVSSSLVGSTFIAARSGDGGILLATAALYSSLYVISLLLENTLDVRAQPVRFIGTVIFSLMLPTSVLALALDAWLVRIGNSWALPVSLGIYLGAAASQWLLARVVLSESPVVPLQFQSHPAQAAHLKNTVYFLVIVILFWLPPFHCVAALRREVQLGHVDWVVTVVGRRLFIGRGFAALSPEVLWYAFILLGFLAIPMAVRLVENLKLLPGAPGNKYTVLLYLRALVYFLLIVVCLFWYSSEIGSLPIQPPTSHI